MLTFFGGKPSVSVQVDKNLAYAKLAVQAAGKYWLICCPLIEMTKGRLISVDVITIFIIKSVCPWAE